MIVLGLDTSTPSTVLGLRLADGTTNQASDDPADGGRPGHATHLLGLADELLGEAGLSWEALERIVVGVGPGTFTGLRVGLATARALSQSLGVELVGVSSLLALSYAARLESADQLTGILPLIDARRDEVFAAVYDDDVELVAPHPLAPADVGEMLRKAMPGAEVVRWLAVGDGAVRYSDLIASSTVQVPDPDCPLHRIQGSALCALGARAVCDGTPVVPDYRRRPDAEIALERVTS